MTTTRMRPGQDPDAYLYHIDSYWDRLNAGDSPEDPTYRHYEDTILQALPSEYDGIRQTHFERRDFGLADIAVRWRLSTWTTCPVQNHHKASGDTAPQCRRWTGATLVSYVITTTNLGISKESAHADSIISSSSDITQFGIISNNSMVNISKSCADGGKTTVEAAEAGCDVYITRQRSITTRTAVSNTTKPAATLV